MKLFIAIACCIFMLNSCKNDDTQESQERQTEVEAKINVETVQIEDLIVDSLLNVRAIELDDRWLKGITSLGKQVSYYLGDKNSFHLLETLNNSNSRCSAIVDDTLLHLSIGTPAELYKGGMLVYYENHPKAFYDSMDFWNDREGIAIGDPTEDCMSIIITRDGGNSWKKLSCDDLPKIKEGEAAFAASDTNIAIVGDHTWVATGGKASRILYSPDKGKTWSAFETPIIQGKETTGMYSIDFYDENTGFAIGGDYIDPDANTSNKIRTSDGGKTWTVVADGKSPGYRSCVQYVPNSRGKGLVAVGFKGIDYSSDAGENWSHLSDTGFYTLRFLNDSVAFAAGKGRISKLLFR